MTAASKTISGIDLLAQTVASPLVEKIRSFALPVERPMGCNCCGRPSSQWLYSDLYVDHKSSYGFRETHCLSCHTLFVPAPEYFGTGVQGRLGSISGAGLLTSPSGSIGYATGKHYTKLSTLEPFFDEVIELAGLASVVDVMGRLPEDEPFLFIENIGSSRTHLVSNLFVSHPGRPICICSEKSHYWLKRSEILQPEDLQGLPKKMMTTSARTGWLDVMQRRTRNLMPHDVVTELRETTRSTPELLALARKLPSDPHTREYMLKIAKKMLEVAQ